MPGEGQNKDVHDPVLFPYPTPGGMSPGHALVVFNVQAGGYNAKGDGKANDAKAIQHAIDDAEGVGIVYFPPGIYNYDRLALSYGVRYAGAGWRASLLRVIAGTGAGQSIVDKTTLAGRGSTGLWLSDLEIRGQSEDGLDGLKLGYGGLGSDQFNFLGGISRCVIRFWGNTVSGFGADLNCNVGEIRDVYMTDCCIPLRTAGAVCRAYGLAIQNTRGGRELQNFAKDSVYQDLHIETQCGPGQISVNVAAGGGGTLFDGVTFSGAPGLVTGTIFNFAATVRRCRVRNLAINLDQVGSNYTNAIFDNDRNPQAVLKTELADPLFLAAYSQDMCEFPQTPAEAVLVSGVDARQGQIFITLTAARNVGAPLNPQKGQTLAFTFIQGGAGAFAVTWSAVFKQTWSDAGNAAGKRSTATYWYDGTNWNQVAPQTAYV